VRRRRTIPEKYRARVENAPYLFAYLEQHGILPQSEAEWDILMNATMRLVPNPLPRHYSGEDVDLFSEGFFTVKEAARHLQLSRATVYRAMERGELPFYKMGKARRIPRKALRIWVEAYYNVKGETRPQRRLDILQRVQETMDRLCDRRWKAILWTAQTKDAAKEKLLNLQSKPNQGLLVTDASRRLESNDWVTVRRDILVIRIGKWALGAPCRNRFGCRLSCGSRAVDYDAGGEIAPASDFGE